MMLAFGLGFEFPILLVFLQLAACSRTSCWPRGAATPSSASSCSSRSSRRAATRSACSRWPSRCIVFYEISILIGRLITADERVAAADARRDPGAFDRSTRFQREAIDALDAGESVLVAAPTGSGKTVVAEHAVAQALADGRQGLLHDADQGAVEPEVRRPGAPPRRRPGRPAHRRQRHQRRRAGGGDDHRGAAQHDLRRVAGARRPALRRARRGPLPPGRLPRPGVGGGHHPHSRPHVRLVCLSATVSNAEELADWIDRRCGARRRRSSRTSGPVELDNLYLVGDRGSRATPPAPDAGRRPPEPRGRRGSTSTARRGAAGRRRPHPAAAATPPAGSRWSSGSTTSDLLPGHLLHLQPGRRATTPLAAVPRRRACASPRPRSGTAIRRDRRARTVGALTDADLDVLGYGRWLAGLEAGVAAHHAGHGAAVQGGGRGVLRRGPGEGGVRHRDPGPRHQHAGPDGGDREALEVHRRAPRVPHAGRSTPSSPGGPGGGASTTSATPSCCGRRSSPSTRWPRWRASRTLRAHVVVPARPTTWPPTWCGATRPTRPTTCSTCPSPSTRPTGTWCGSRRGSSARRRELARPRRGRPHCERGDVDEYRAPASTPSDAARRRRAPGATGRRGALGALKPGDVIDAPGRQVGRAGGRALRGATAARGDVRVRVRHRRPAACLTLGARRLRPRRPSAVGRVELPEPVHAPTTTPSSARWPTPSRRLPRPPADRAAPSATATTATGTADRRRPPGRRLPRPATSTCGPPRRAERAASGRSPTSSAGSRAAPSRSARQFDRVLRVLEAWGYLDGWALTEPRRAAGPDLPRVRPAGRRGARRGPARRPRPRRRWPAWRRCFTYEHRSPGPPPPPWFPSATVRRALGRPRAASPASSTGRGGARGLPLTRAARPRVLRPGPRLGGGRGPRRRARGRGAVGRRLRPQREAAHRPAAPDRRRRPRTRRPRAARRRAARADGALFRGGASAAASEVGDGEPRADRPVTIREGRGLGRPRARCPTTACVVRTDAEARAVVERGPPGGRADRRRSACSAATCAARSAAAATTGRLRSDDAMTLPGRPRRGARRRPPALVRRPPRRPPALVAGPGRRRP